MITVAPVHVWLPGCTEPVLAGEFTHDASGPVGRFRYARSYLDAKHPPLAPDLPLRSRPIAITGGKAIFPLFLDAGPDAWGRHLLARRLERDVSEIEALTLCPTDGVGNIALGDLTPERLRVLTSEEFLEILGELEAGGMASTPVEEQVLDATQNGTSLGGTKPKLTLSRDGVQYLAKFPEPADSKWLPHIECAMLKLARACEVDACKQPEVWHLSAGKSALLVPRFDRVTTATGITKIGYVSAHAILRLDLMQQGSDETLHYGTVGYTPSGLRKSYVSFASDIARWCGGREAHWVQRRELWRRIVFNALIRNIDDHSKNHGLLCDSMADHQWRLSPAFDLVPAAAVAQQPALSMAYRYIPPSRRRGEQGQPRLVARIDTDDLLAAATEHYGYAPAEAEDYLRQTAGVVANGWRKFMLDEGVSAQEAARFEKTFRFAEELATGQLSLDKPS